ncbi:MAG: hypothetical protein FWE36_01690 [Erysipelotrichales bacterium]|nr:hypothetical protein [Erysipelotrichales bacterium]
MADVPKSGIAAEYFKKYLIFCEYLQIDPSQEYDLSYISKRIKGALDKWDEDDNDYERKKLEKSLHHLEKNYKSFIGFWCKFSKKCRDMIKKGKLTIHPETVNNDYIKKGLSQRNYDCYAKQNRKSFKSMLLKFAVWTIICILAILFIFIIL